MISRKSNWYGKSLLERRAYYSPLRACSLHSSNGQVNLLTHKENCESVIATVGWPRYWITAGLRQCQAICIPTCSPKLDAVEIQSELSTEQGRPRHKPLVLLAGTPCWACPCPCWGPLGEWEHSIATHFTECPSAITVQSTCSLCSRQHGRQTIDYLAPQSSVSAYIRRGQAVINTARRLWVRLPTF